MQFDQIPGMREALAAAAAEEELRRDLAFCDLELDIAGEPVRQLTPRHMMLLFQARSPFFCGGRRQPEHVAQFLWAVSPQFSPDVRTRDAFLERIAETVPFQPARDGIEEYLDQALMDSPPTSSRRSRHAAICSFLAVLVHRIASAYHWDEGAILEKPIARLYQYLRLLDRDAGETVFFNKLTDRAQRERYAAWKAEQKAAAAGTVAESSPAPEPAAETNRVLIIKPPRKRKKNPTT